MVTVIAAARSQGFRLRVGWGRYNGGSSFGDAQVAEAEAEEADAGVASASSGGTSGRREPVKEDLVVAFARWHEAREVTR
jgi:hypothetical protein